MAGPAAATAQWSEDKAAATGSLTISAGDKTTGNYYFATGGALPLYEATNGNLFLYDAAAGDVLPGGAVLRRAIIRSDTIMVI